MIKKISIGCDNNTSVLLVKKLFELGYSPDQIEIFYSFTKPYICDTYQISSHFVNNNDSFLAVLDTGPRNLLINVGALPFLVTPSVLNNFTVGAINLHTGLSQHYRGRWMVSWAIINNESTCGYTWHFMDNDFDTGNILLQQEFEINCNDTALSLNNKIFNHAVEHLDRVLELSHTTGTPLVVKGKYYTKEKPFNGVIQPVWDTAQIDRFIRAMYHPPYTPAIYIKNGVEYQVRTFEEYQQHANS